MAPKAKAINHHWNADLAEATSAATSGALLSNHSYGLIRYLVQCLTICLGIMAVMLDFGIW